MAKVKNFEINEIIIFFWNISSFKTFEIHYKIS